MSDLRQIISKIEDSKKASKTGWKKKQNSSLKLGMKHSARVATRRAIKDNMGNNLMSDILSIIASRFISKSI